MRKLNTLVELRKVDEGIGYFWKAYFRGTANRVKREDGSIVQGYTKQSSLRFDLLNNPMERGVLAFEVK